jgi:hypothetical protein
LKNQVIDVILKRKKYSVNCWKNTSEITSAKKKNNSSLSLIFQTTQDSSPIPYGLKKKKRETNSDPSGNQPAFIPER